jgi:hypothetical protein
MPYIPCIVQPIRELLSIAIKRSGGKLVIRTKSQFIDLVRPGITSNDIGIVCRVEAYVELAILGGLERGSLARAVLEAFPESQLAVDVANVISN